MLMKSEIFISFTVIKLLSLVWQVHSEVYTALVDLEPLLETHKRIIDDLDSYIEKEEKRLILLKRHLSLYKKEHEKAMSDIPNYLGNPIHAFTLIKRLTTDLDRIENVIQIGTEYIRNVTMLQKDVKYPTSEDLGGAAQALTRLQETYQLDVETLSEGIINGIQYSTPLTASDCYELGRALYVLEDYQNALQWMLVALRKHQANNEQDLTDIELYEYIAFSHYLMDDVEEALAWTYRILSIAPNHIRALGNIPHYKQALINRDEKLKRRRRGETGEEELQGKELPPTNPKYWNSVERKSYEALCRGEMSVPVKVTRRLKCRYTSENHPFLKIAPFKVEEAYLDPNVYVFHDVMSDYEIEYIKDMARPRFKRAVVHSPETGEMVPAHYRISKSGWLRDEESPIVSRISQRVADITGLSMDSAEELQVVNYGIGGHYEPHFDFARKSENRAFTGVQGNRIATVLFYMSDVAQGGATVFTELGLSVFPKRGSALFWLNLHPSGEGDFATRHAACPVLRGSKWVSNKWIHQSGQELLRPCTLDYQIEGIIKPVPKPVTKSSR